MKHKKNFSLVERTGSTLLEQFRFQEKHKNKKHTSDSMDIITVDNNKDYLTKKKSRKNPKKNQIRQKKGFFEKK